MNSTTYLKMLAREWGGMKEELLTEKLTRLVILAQSEVGIKVKPKEVTLLDTAIKHEVIIKKDIPSPVLPEEILIENIKAIESDNKGNYEKALLLTRLFKQSPGWHHVTLIPDNIFNDFWNLCEMKKSGIFFDSEREYQYFKVM